MRKEFLARILVVGLVAAAAALPLVFRTFEQRARPGHMFELHARMPENGGWLPESISVPAGQPLTLRMTSDDVVHGFAVGQSDVPPVDIHPGEIVETTLVFDEPGTYTFYCTRWCGENHWRMRGTIDVTGPLEPQTVEPPLFVQLGIDIDAPHPAPVLPVEPPSAENGAGLAERLPGYALDPYTYQTHSKADLWQKLRGDPTLLDLSDQQLWDAVAYVWSANTTPEQIQRGQELYAQNCAACHGQTGQGDGIMMPEVPELNPEQPKHMESVLPDFSDPEKMYGASPALLEGKIVRGGMGTGMPSWGAILKPEEIDAILAFLYTLSQQPGL